MNGHVSFGSTGDKFGVANLDVIRIGMIAIATVKTVLENPRYVRNVGNSEDESFFGAEIAHVVFRTLLI
jgi:hypothetical protein